MHILITNDDGIQAEGLKALGAAVLEAGHRLTVCAPETQQSAASQRLTLDKPLMTREIPWAGAKAWAVEGTPADCVRIGLRLAENRVGPAAQPMPEATGDAPDTQVDFVLSGINNGWNAGTAVYYSGTFSAAREAAMAYRRAMAVSMDTGATEEMLTWLARTAVKLAERMEKASFPKTAVLNLNAPALPPEKLKEMRIAPLSDAFFKDEYEKRESPRKVTYFWLGAGLQMEPHAPGTDLDLLEKGHVTLSLVTGFREDPEWLAERIREQY